MQTHLFHGFCQNPVSWVSAFLRTIMVSAPPRIPPASPLRPRLPELPLPARPCPPLPANLIKKKRKEKILKIARSRGAAAPTLSPQSRSVFPRPASSALHTVAGEFAPFHSLPLSLSNLKFKKTRQPLTPDDIIFPAPPGSPSPPNIFGSNISTSLSPS